MRWCEYRFFSIRHCYKYQTCQFWNSFYPQKIVRLEICLHPTTTTNLGLLGLHLSSTKVSHGSGKLCPWIFVLCLLSFFNASSPKVSGRLFKSLFHILNIHSVWVEKEIDSFFDQPLGQLSYTLLLKIDLLSVFVILKQVGKDMQVKISDFGVECYFFYMNDVAENKRFISSFPKSCQKLLYCVLELCIVSE